MTVCPRCGTQNAPHLPACAMCGMLLGRGVPKGTLVGISPFYTPPPAPPAPESEAPHPLETPHGPFADPHYPAPGRPEAPPYQEPPPAPAPFPKGTLFGVAPPVPPTGPVPEPAPPERFGRTMMGMAPVTRQPEPPHAAPREYAPAAAHSPPAQAPADLPMSRTILGVARPGIAPLEPGIRKEPVLAPPPAQPQAFFPDATATSFPFPQAPPALSIPGPPSLPSVTTTRPRGIPVLAAIAVTVAAGLVAAGAVVLLWHRGTGPIEGRAALGADGKEQLELVCRDCPDGTRVGLGKALATIKGTRGTLTLPEKLKVGDNRLDLLLTRPGDRKATEVALTVPVQYRVRADTSALAEATPRLRVVVEAIPKSTVSIDGRPLELGADGRGAQDVDIASELVGAEPSVKKLERVIPYSVTPPGGAAESGKVTFQLGVTALAVEAPGERITIDTPTFVLSGRSQRGATVTVAERPIQLDAEGRFAQVMSVSSEGETKISVRAQAPEHAPRLYAIQIKRVARLADEAAKQRSKAITAFDSVGDADANKGKEVALDGTLLEHRSEGYVSYLLVDVTSGCRTSPCLLRVVHGAPVRIEKGAGLSVFGTVTRSVDGARAGTRVPEVFASFLVPSAK